MDCVSIFRVSRRKDQNQLKSKMLCNMLTADCNTIDKKKENENTTVYDSCPTNWVHRIDYSYS